jgi:hypothetical protein
VFQHPIVVENTIIQASSRMHEILVSGKVQP